MSKLKFALQIIINIIIIFIELIISMIAFYLLLGVKLLLTPNNIVSITDCSLKINQNQCDTTNTSALVMQNWFIGGISLFIIFQTIYFIKYKKIFLLKK